MGFNGLDINMGCPVRKIVERGSCGALIENPGLAAELTAALAVHGRTVVQQSEGAADWDAVALATNAIVCQRQCHKWIALASPISYSLAASAIAMMFSNGTLGRIASWLGLTI